MDDQPEATVRAGHTGHGRVLFEGEFFDCFDFNEAHHGASRVYATPAWCTRAILPHLGRPDYFDRVVDPCCGDGAILDVIAEQWPDHRQSLRGVEIDARRADIAGKKHRVACADALGETQWDRAVELVVTNPPFSLAMDFVQRALEEVAPGGTVAMLLRLPWLASQKRAPWLRENTPGNYDDEATVYEQVDVYLSPRATWMGGDPAVPQCPGCVLFGCCAVHDSDDDMTDDDKKHEGRRLQPTTSTDATPRTTKR